MLLWNLGTDRLFLQSGIGGTLREWLITDLLGVLASGSHLGFPLEVMPQITFLRRAIADQEEAI